MAKKKRGRPALPKKIVRKPRSIKIRDEVYSILHKLGNGSYSKGIEFLVYTYIEENNLYEKPNKSIENEPCPESGNG